jgi:hypothetical protein
MRISQAPLATGIHAHVILSMDTLSFSFFLSFFLVLGLELRAFPLSQSTSPIFVKDFTT